MKSDNNLSDTIELNVEKARRAVGNLFDENDGYDEHTEIEDDERDAPDMRRVTNLFAEPLPPPKPAVKVNASVPAASRAPIRPKRPLSVEDEETAGRSGAAGWSGAAGRPGKSRYLFIEDEDDEFTTFRKRYRDREAESREKPQAPEPQRRPSNPDPSHTPRRKRPPAMYQGEPTTDSYTEPGIPAAIRTVIIGLTVVLLLMMAFLVYRITVISGELNVANDRLQGIPAMQEELARTMIYLEAARADLVLAEAENAQLLRDLGSYLMGTITGSTGPSDPADDGQASDPAAATPEPGADRIHIVATGDNLYRISVQFYGSGSYANIQRIMAANNIIDPDLIRVGDQIIIP